MQLPGVGELTEALVLVILMRLASIGLDYLLFMPAVCPLVS